MFSTLIIYNQLGTNGNQRAVELKYLICHSKQSPLNQLDQLMYSLKTLQKCGWLLSERSINENGYNPFDQNVSRVRSYRVSISGRIDLSNVPCPCYFI